ncbi:MAG TPA: methyltransferase domain-containing protein [Candidatus Limnocylindrales bacterium]|nr:methyltransferase domain-containing protein [Candidatus Limnocylindrales bacterium]
MERLPDAVELLDGPLDDPDALVGNLRDLRRMNRALGGVRLSRLAIDRLLDGAAKRREPHRTEVESAGRELSLLDVGTGGADIPVALLADARRRGRPMRIVAIDSRPEIVAAASIARPGIAHCRGLLLDVGNGDSLPYPEAAFDVVHCSLVLHHHGPRDAVALLAEMARVARLGIVVNDLARGRLAWLGAATIATLLTPNRYTRHDAPLSVRRAYTLAEVGGLLADAGLRPVAEIGGIFGHRFAIAAVPR